MSFKDTVIQGDCLDVLKRIPDEVADCCVTSPPYYGLRDYGMNAQIGLEETPEKYIEKLVAVFREIRRVLKDDGTLWLNIGDSYCGTGDKGNYKDPKYADGRNGQAVSLTKNLEGCKKKDLIGIPWMLAFALRNDGWYLRQDIIWHKPNPMPESVKDRCTKAHEYIFLMSKKPHYYFDYEAIQEPAAFATYQRLSQDIENQEGGYTPSKKNGKMKAVGYRLGSAKYGDSNDPHYRNKSGKEWYPQYKNLMNNGQQNHSMHERRAEGLSDETYIVRNKRDVWSVTTKPCKEAHFATFPEDLIEPCILAGSRIGGIVLDPFFGSGTTGRVANKFNRHYIGIELNPEYIEISNRRTNNVQMTMEGFV